jgi:hypothetical protein
VALRQPGLSPLPDRTIIVILTPRDKDRRPARKTAAMTGPDPFFRTRSRAATVSRGVEKDRTFDLNVSVVVRLYSKGPRVSHNRTGRAPRIGAAETHKERE